MRPHRDRPWPIREFPFYIRHKFNTDPRRAGDRNEPANLLGKPGGEVVAKQFLATVETKKPANVKRIFDLERLAGLRNRRFA